MSLTGLEDSGDGDRTNRAKVLNSKVGGKKKEVMYAVVRQCWFFA